MADPLGLIGAGGTGGAGGIGPVRGRSPATGAGSTPGAPSFSDTLLKEINEVNRLQAEAGQAVEDFASGKRADIENVIVGTQKADAAFKMLLALRNKVQTAYEEVKQVRI